MEVQPSGRLRMSFKNATILITVLNLIAAIFLLHSFLSSSSSPSKFSSKYSSAELSYIKESEEIRRAMRPMELIKRVKEIQQEAFPNSEIVEPKDTKQTAAFDLSKRLKDFRSLNDASSLKALEEWRKRKMERARRRELEKNGTASFQA
ncbi:hypothetical protein K2173_021484 [Erythroxylum novogranatense]|uniref:Transmembrane protein n=1 Tax=Erythroxylum novogranatense TaxID=1862640 RepID=A0AAV8TPE7_9ROSI|nr:hypothetical protein K2173_021484 [Erythroxylum novogranatense]